MKLNIVRARTGVQWVRQGIRAFGRQPIALMGLFLIYMLALTLVAALPLVGTALALVLLPAASLGFMAATLETTQGRFPMPSILASAFRVGRERARAVLILGALYAVGFLLIMGLSSLIDGGQVAKIYLGGEAIEAKVFQQSSVQTALWLSMGLYLPLSLLFWHAPALVHWHGISPVKAMFFSVVACLRNAPAFVVYGLTWLGVFLFAGFIITLVGALFGNAEVAALVMSPVAVLLATMFFCSTYFSFQSCFLPDTQPAVLPPS